MEKRQFPETSPRRRGSSAISPKVLLGAIIALLVVLLLLMSVISLAEKHRAIRSRITDLRNEQSALERKEAKLTETNEYLATPEGAEQTLRAKFNLVRPGEELIVITATPEPQAPEGPKTRVGRWWDRLLKGLGVRE